LGKEKRKERRGEKREIGGESTPLNIIKNIKKYGGKVEVREEKRGEGGTTKIALKVQFWGGRKERKGEGRKERYGENLLPEIS
jgi:hypothetical protein